MAQSALEVGNAALIKIGESAVSSVTGGDTSKAGTVLFARLDPLKRQLLRSYVWNFAIKRKVLVPPASFAISNVTWISSQIVEVTHATVTFALGSYVTLAGIVGATLANGAFEVQTATAGGITTRITVPAATTAALLGTYVASTGDTIRQSPAFDYAYLYTLPTDCLRVITINEQVRSDQWRIEGRSILSNSTTSLALRYVQDVTDYTTMDIAFYECLSTWIAWGICDHITGSDSKKRDLWTDLKGGDGKIGLLPSARFEDAAEDSPQSWDANDWVGARFGAGGGWFEPITVTTSPL